MKRTLLLLFFPFTSTFAQTDTLYFSYGEYVETYWYSVFTKGDEEITFYNPDMQPYDDGMGNILDELKELPYIITYSPWEDNEAYHVIESITTELNGVFSKVIEIYQPGMDEVNIVFEDAEGNRFDLPLDTRYLTFKDESLTESGPMGQMINSEVYERMMEEEVYFIGTIDEQVHISNWIY